jgi:hypothetical protein
MAVDVDTSGRSPRYRRPIALFQVHRPTLRTNAIEFDVTRNGRRFLLIEPTEQEMLQPLTVVSDWLRAAGQ